jgi:hypothetical protein
MLCEGVVTFREDVLFSQLSNPAACDLDMPAKRFRVPPAIIFDRRTFLHPFVDLFSPQVDLSFYARR